MRPPELIPGGYMAKRVADRPEWLDAPQVKRICSQSRCVSEDFAEAWGHWRQNGLDLYDTPSVIEEITVAEGVECAGLTLFYYEFYPEQADWCACGDEPVAWTPFAVPDTTASASVRSDGAVLIGWDVIVYEETGQSGCSPLSCNSMAGELPTNADCLFDSFEAAKAAVDGRKFLDCEPGLYRIAAVYEVGPLSCSRA